jgi:S-adenosylmethionine decarboxylase
MNLTVAQASLQEKGYASEGTHIIANFTSDRHSQLVSHALFKDFIDKLIAGIELSKVGEVYHDFEGGGFTAVVCLAESHLSIHTWPERKYVTFDVFLSNFSRNNQDKTETIYTEIRSFFAASISFEKTILR